MNNELCAAEPKARKSLMNALEDLESKARNLVDLANFSDTVVDKLNNPRPQLGPQDGCCVAKENVNEPIPDLIDLFNKVAENIERATNRIGNNTEWIKSFIE